LKGRPSASIDRKVSILAVQSISKGDLMRLRLRIILTLLLTAGLLGLSSLPIRAQSAPNPERNAYFGEARLHTNRSFDAYIFGKYISMRMSALIAGMADPQQTTYLAACVKSSTGISIEFEPRRSTAPGRRKNDRS
jgi:Protein of unknown function (DUF3604)